MTRSWPQARQWALDQGRRGPAFQEGHCLEAVRTAWAVPSLYGSAGEAWSATRLRVAGPAGFVGNPGNLVWWVGGSHGFGHVAISLGDGDVLTVDVEGAGLLRRASFDRIARWAPDLHLAGFSRDLNGVRVLREKPWKPGESSEEHDMSLMSTPLTHVSRYPGPFVQDHDPSAGA